MDKVTAILQARMSSRRLPGKVLMEVLGRPLLAYEIERLQRCSSLRDIVLATSDQPQDEPVATLGKQLGVKVFRGSEDDVLDRYYWAAKDCDAEHVMRVTGDCPLIEPGICELAVDTYFKMNADYLCTSPRFAEGLDCEIISMSALETAWKEAAAPSEREHVTLFVRNRPDRHAMVELDNDSDDSAYRVTVDDPEDFEVVKAVMKALIPAHGSSFGWQHTKTFLDTHPNIMAMNAEIVRNEGLAVSLAKEAK
ncbi:glycosyltransferase family protein [Pseudodesulfovibrio sp.]|nr:glycosyltransferase family protein [Pseudodesulfovibrio sp.]